MAFVLTCFIFYNSEIFYHYVTFSGFHWSALTKNIKIYVLHKNNNDHFVTYSYLFAGVTIETDRKVYVGKLLVELDDMGASLEIFVDHHPSPQRGEQSIPRERRSIINNNNKQKEESGGLIHDKSEHHNDEVVHISNLVHRRKNIGEDFQDYTYYGDPIETVEEDEIRDSGTAYYLTDDDIDTHMRGAADYDSLGGRVIFDSKGSKYSEYFQEDSASVDAFTLRGQLRKYGTELTSSITVKHQSLQRVSIIIVYRTDFGKNLML